MQSDAVYAAHREWARTYSQRVRAAFPKFEGYPAAQPSATTVSKVDTAKQTVKMLSRSTSDKGCSATGRADTGKLNCKKEILTVGYVSPDFQTHSVSYFIEGEQYQCIELYPSLSLHCLSLILARNLQVHFGHMIVVVCVLFVTLHQWLETMKRRSCSKMWSVKKIGGILRK